MLYSLIHFPPNLTHITSHYTALLNADVPNFYVTRWIYCQIAHVWCQSEDRILSRQLSCVEATARHAQVVPGRVFVFQQDGARRSCRFPGARNASSSKRLCPCTRCTFRVRILTILSRSVITSNNSAKYFSLLYANAVVR